MKISDIICEQANLNNLAIRFDMDGVIADFDAQARTLGFDVSGLNSSSADLPDAGKTQKREFYAELKKAGLPFWTDMPVMPGSMKLWRMAHDATSDVGIITAVPKVDLTVGEEGKRQWLMKNFQFSANSSNFVATSSSKKQDFKPNVEYAVLIDDRLPNCQRWTQAGGIAIHYKSADQAAQELSAIIQQAQSGESNPPVEDDNQIDETLMTFGNDKYGNIVFMSGGAASGKGFTIDQFMNGTQYKIRDVDAFKTMFLKIAQLKNKYPEIQGLDLRNPDDVFKLHTFVKNKGIKDKTLDLLLQNVSKDRLPNVIFDITGKSISDVTSVLPQLSAVGYQPEHINLVWVLTNVDTAQKNNLSPDRGRIVPADILIDTHSGAAKTMSTILSSGAGSYGIDGTVNVVINNPENTKIAKQKIKSDPEMNKRLKDAGSYTGKPKKLGDNAIEGFTYINLKRPKKSQVPFKQAVKQLKVHIAKNSPPGSLTNYE